MHRLHALDATLAEARLAAAIGALVPLLAAEQDGVRLAAGRAIQCAVSTCLMTRYYLLFKLCIGLEAGCCYVINNPT